MIFLRSWNVATCKQTLQASCNWHAISFCRPTQQQIYENTHYFRNPAPKAPKL